MKKLAIIGASYLQLPLVKKAKEMGIETHCFAWKEGAVCETFADFFYPISITEKENILDVCQKIRIDGITSISSDLAVNTVNYIAESMSLIGNSYTKAFTDKYEMRKKFQEHGVLSPKYILSDGISKDFDSILKPPLIVKPTDRSGSRGVSLVENSSNLSSALSYAHDESFSKRVIIEEFISGNEVSVESISWKGNHYVLAITDKVTTGAPYFVELEHHQPSLLPETIQEKIKAQTIKALNALNIQYGASHAEFKITDNGDVYVIEVGARMGGDFIGSDLVQLSTGYDFVKAIIQMALGNFEKPIFTQKKYSGVYFLSKETEYLISRFNSLNSDKQIVKAEITNNQLNTIRCSADRSGYFIYQTNKKLL